MAEAKKLLGRNNNHLGQLWYRSLTLRHVLSLLDQVEDVAKVSSYLICVLLVTRLCLMRFGYDLS